MAATDSLRTAINGMTPKDRKQLALFGAVLVLGLVFGLWVLSAALLSGLEEQRAATLDALRVIRSERARIRQRQQQRAQVLARYEQRAPALGSFIEQAARAAEVTVTETNDRPVQRVDSGRFERRSTSIRLRSINLQKLVAFMAQIDNAPFPVAITTLRLRKRFNESNNYDVDEMVITTFDRVRRAGESRTERDGGVGRGLTPVAVPVGGGVAVPSTGATR
ncbi:MAG: hypothetical protein JNK05_31115 [Myxococcales bacterium]|nr:hypothetical protein [Myxococcales bacterium]